MTSTQPSRYYPDEAAAILEAAQEAAAAKGWPAWLLAGIVPMITLTDDRTGMNGFPTRGAWLSGLAAILVADLKEEPAPGWTAFAGFVGDAANQAMRENAQTGAFARMWAGVKNGFLSAASAAAAVAVGAIENAAGAAATTGVLTMILLGFGGFALAAWGLKGGPRGR